MSTTYGYCRVSTQKQNIERQTRNIKESFPDAVIVEDAFTGTKLDRPGWNKLRKKVTAGDTIVFDSVSRMSRDAVEGAAIYTALFDEGIELVFLKEPFINTATYKRAMTDAIPMTGTKIDGILTAINTYLKELATEQIRLAFDQAEKEVQDLRKRTSEGIETARLNGKQIGRVAGDKLTTKKSVAMKAVIRQHSKDFGGTLSDTECMKLTGLARNTFYKYKRELKAE